VETDERESLDDCFRREYGKLVAVLVRGFGTHHIELIEDAVQEAMVAALAGWGRGGMPSRPVAWLQQVARNRLIDELRKQHPSDPLPPGLDDPGPGPDAALADRRRLPDDLLRMLFLCADEQLPVESQLVLALKVVCGFSTEEIGRRLFTSEANVYKRLQRGRDLLRARGAPGELPRSAVLQGRASAVRQMIYLLFNEGYSSACADQLVRRELCDEAIYLGSVLAAHPVGDHPETWALLALMAFHFARLDARTDGAGGLLLLEEQDRSLWDRELIALGFRWLGRAATGDVFSRYHAEAAIAAEHCLAPTFAETRWQEVIDLYEILERHELSPLHTLNRAIAVAQLHGPAVALAILHAIKPPGWLLGYYLWDAVLGELERRAGNLDRARQHLRRALEAAPTHAEQALLKRRLQACDAGGGIA
jgi:RNA polymerase sigma-70 factor (ECF subfamily)